MKIVIKYLVKRLICLIKGHDYSTLEWYKTCCDRCRKGFSDDPVKLFFRSIICHFKGHKEFYVLYSPDIPIKYRTLGRSCAYCRKVKLRGSGKWVRKVYEKHDPYYLMIKDGYKPY